MAQTPVGTAFTYQGQLKSGGLPVTDTADFQFTLWDALAGGSQIGAMIPVNGKSVTNGLFTVTLDFGAGAFAGNARWLEIAVRSPAGGGAYQTLSPRQELKPAPQAIYATSAGSVPSGITGSGSADTVPKFTAGSTIGGSIISESGGRIGIGTSPGAKLHVGGTAGTDGIMFPDGTLQKTAPGGGAGAWGLRGNAGTNPPTDFLGTTDNKPLELKVNGARALRLEPNANGPNLVGGASSNTIDAGLYGSIIGGGVGNHVSASYSTISGGYYNTASGNYSAVLGGSSNTASAGNSSAFGGGNNRASGNYSAVFGGTNCIASGFISFSGGNGNSASGDNSLALGGAGNSASGPESTVLGGEYNTAAGLLSLAAGSHAYAGHAGAFVWADSTTTANWSSTGANMFLIKAAGGVGINTNAPTCALHVVGGLRIAGGGESLTTSGPGSAERSVLTASGTLDLSGSFLITIPQAYYYSWQADNYAFKVEVYVSLDPTAGSFEDRGSAYQMEIVGKERGTTLTHFTELHKVANDATFTFTYSASGTDLQISVLTNRAPGKPYRVTVVISR
jgi:hypothetical protein